MSSRKRCGFAPEKSTKISSSLLGKQTIFSASFVELGAGGGEGDGGGGLGDGGGGEGDGGGGEGGGSARQANCAK